MDNRKTDNPELEQDILFGIINRFIGYFTRAAVPNTTNDTTHEYPFVAMDTRQAYDQLALARDRLREQQSSSEPIKFIDIGCGIGNILLIAEMMEFEIFGIEKDLASLETAKGLVGEEYVSCQDIWTFDRIDQFDIVYYFRPFCEKNYQLRFERLVEEHIKPGGILIANRKMSTEIGQQPEFIRLDPDMPIWQKS
ncbi:MAG: class I SAM-dependent methyltransferase [Desulfobulbaceae bacterium]|nr:MAG: class I SAM-dependent methyltransferase [Desulfobulbaceae bacterium]